MKNIKDIEVHFEEVKVKKQLNWILILAVVYFITIVYFVLKWIF